MGKMSLFVLLFITTSVLVFSGSIDNITFITEQYPPFNYIENGKVTGLSVEIIDAIFKKTGANKSVDDINLYPWARGYNDVLNKSGTSLFVITKTEEREPLFKWIGPIADTRIVLIAKKNRYIKICSYDDLSKYKIGVIREDVGYQLLKGYGVPDNVFNITSETLSNILMLENDRIDMIAYEETVIFRELENAGIDPSCFTSVYTLTEAELYYAFNKKTDDAVIRQIQTAFDELVKDGICDTIKSKYLYSAVKK